MEVSDYRINAAIRSILVKHWVDHQRLTFGSFRGTVRIRGELCYLGTAPPANLSQVEVIEGEIRAVHGVKRVHFELSNWVKNHLGKWSCIEKSRVLIAREREMSGVVPVTIAVPFTEDQRSPETKKS
jgi:hypothetical protein